MRETDLKGETVDSDGDGSDHAGVEFLVVRVTLGAADVGELPFEVCSGREIDQKSRRDASRVEEQVSGGCNE